MQVKSIFSHHFSPAVHSSAVVGFEEGWGSVGKSGGITKAHWPLIRYTCTV